MSKDFEYDPETGSFRFDEGDGKTKKKNDVDVGGWILIAALFAFGLWPIGLIALISKLSDKPKKVNSSRGGTRTSTSPNANVSSHSKVEKSVVKTAKQMNRAPAVSNKSARTLMIIGGINWGLVGLFQFDFVGWLLGGSSSIWSRIVFTVVGIAAVCGIPGLFADEEET